MQKREFKAVKTEKIVDVICNICNRSLIGHSGNVCGLDISIYGNYDSTRLIDEASYSFSICEDCLLEKIAPLFSIPITIQE